MEFLHLTIQDAMGWKNYHLHEFETTEGLKLVDYSCDEGGGDDDDEQDYTVASIFSVGSKVNYTYDFGDNWVHQVVCEKIIEDESRLEGALCVGGHKAGPPEDVGGAYGHEELVAILSDPEHAEYAERRDWLKRCGYLNYDPNLFERRGPVGPGPRPYNSEVYQLKIILMEQSKFGIDFPIESDIWRRILIPGSSSMAQLHDAIQRAMGWRNCHLHKFELSDGTELGTVEDDFSDDEDFMDEKEITVQDAYEDKRPVKYTYDFGDNWEHMLILEQVRPNKEGLTRGVCIDGEKACPPEDVGSLAGYRRLLNIIANPGHREHNEMKQWLTRCGYKDFKPDHFNVRV